MPDRENRWGIYCRICRYFLRSYGIRKDEGRYPGDSGCDDWKWMSGGIPDRTSISGFMSWLGSLINWGTEQQPFLMGIIVSVLMGMILTLPISSAALGVILNLSVWQQVRQRLDAAVIW